MIDCKPVGFPIFIAALLATPCLAQSDGNAPLTLELPASTRALGVGGAFVLSFPDNDAVFYQPGLLDAARGVGIAVQRYGSWSTLGVFSGATELLGGGFALGIQALSYGTDGVGLSGIPDNANDLLVDGTYGASDVVASIGYGRELLWDFRGGIVGKGIETRVGGRRAATAAVDVGLARSVLGITLGVSAQNLGPGLSIDDADLPLPMRVTVGASTRRYVVGPLDVLATAAVSRRHDGEVIPAGGLEIAYWPIVGRTFMARVGARRVPDDGASPVTLGFGFRADDLTVEYAFEDFDAAGAAHRIGVRWH